MLLTKQQIALLHSAAIGLADDAKEETLEQFSARVLGLNALQSAQFFPDSDSGAVGSINVSAFTKSRDKVLRDNGVVPSFVVYRDPSGSGYRIAGIATYLRDLRKGVHGSVDFLQRLGTRAEIHKELQAFKKGHDLELLAAAIFHKACAFGEATSGSGDQGVDALAWQELLSIEDVFLDGHVDPKAVRSGSRVYFVASSKAVLKPGSSGTRLVSPAHIRELVGSWLIQRSAVGAWAHLGLQMLTPLQLVLVTTYRLSEDSQHECKKLGIQVWSMAELTYLICRYAPPEVFGGSSGKFSAVEFKNWWAEKGKSRVKRPAVAA